MPSFWSEFEYSLIDIIKNEYKLLYLLPGCQTTQDISIARKNAWDEIALRLNKATPDGCRYKWYEICSRYRKEKTKAQNMNTGSKYLDGTLNFMDKYLNLSKELTKSEEMILYDTRLVTLDNIDWVLSIKENDPSQSVCVTEAMIETILKSKNFRISIGIEESTEKTLEDGSKNPIDDFNKPTKPCVTLDEKIGKQKKSQHSNVNKTDSSLTQCQLTQTAITSLLDPNESTCEVTVNGSDSESDDFVSHEVLPIDDNPTITLESSNLDTKNGIPNIELSSTSNKGNKSDDEEMNIENYETERVKIEEQNSSNIVDNQIEIDTQKFFTDLGIYVESRFSAEKQNTLRLQIMSLITQAESDLI